jgi:hypothetical protein
MLRRDLDGETVAVVSLFVLQIRVIDQQTKIARTRTMQSVFKIKNVSAS